MVNQRKRFYNENVSIHVEFNEKGRVVDISGKDSKDFYNEESFFTKTKRNLKNVLDFLLMHKKSITNEGNEFVINDAVNFRSVIDKLEENNINYHRYCAID